MAHITKSQMAKLTTNFVVVNRRNLLFKRATIVTRLQMVPMKQYNAKTNDANIEIALTGRTLSMFVPFKVKFCSIVSSLNHN